MQALHLEIVTPDKLVLSTDVDYIGAPGVDGEFGILSKHISLLSALALGKLYYKQANKTSWVFVSGGFLEVADNKVSILAEAAELAEDIDKARAQEALQRANNLLASNDANVNKERAKKALARAQARLDILDVPNNK